MMKALIMALLLVGATFCQVAVPSEQSTLHPDDNLIATSTAASSNNNPKEVNHGDEPAVLLPAPVDVSFAVGVQGAGEGVVPRVEVDTDGVPVVHGVVMPDDPSDTKTWRNARVLNNVLISNNNSAIQEQQDMFIYRPASSVRILNDDFQPSPADTASFSPSLPYPAFYYQRFYQDKSPAQPQLPDSLAVETDEEDSSSSPSEAVESVSEGDPNVDGRGFNIKKKNTGIVKAKPGSSYGAGARPISYYVQAEEAKGIHDDRSPYDYEPAQHQSTNYYTSDYSTQESVSKQDVQYYQQQLEQQQQQQLQLQQQEEQQMKLKHQQEQKQLQLQQEQQLKFHQQQLLQQQQDQQLQLQQQQLLLQQQQQTQQETNPQRTGYYQQNSFLPGNVVPAPQDSFVIRDQTYTSGGQTFSVPIPVPKDQYVQQYGQQQQYAAQQQPQYAYNFQQYPAQFSQQYYKQQQQTQQPLDFLGAKFKEQVQKAKDKLHGLTDPVVDPLMEAGQKISTNLGLPDRVNQINQKVATPGILVPLAMVGGAALALGGLSTAIHLSNPETKHNVFKTLKIDNSTLAERITTALHPYRNATRVSRSVEDEGYPAAEFVDEEKENLLDHVLSALNGPQKSFLAQMQQTGFDEWQKTPCAKRIFCDVMIQQPDDSINLMEKRMSTFLSLLESGVARNLQALTSDVMDGIRRRNCRAFVCGSVQSQASAQQQ